MLFALIHAAILFADVDVNSKAYRAGAVCGSITAVLFCAAIPIAAGLRCQKPVLGVIGGVISGAFAIPFACLSGLPIAMVWLVVILCVANASNKAPHRRSRARADWDEDDDRRPRRRQKRLDELEDEEEERARRGGTRASDVDSRRRRRRYDDDD